MKTKIIASLILGIILFVSACNSEKKTTTPPPDWSKEVVWYQVFVERFNNGDSTNNPTAATISTASDFRAVPDNWHVTPWTQSWYEEDQWAKDLGNNFYGNLQLRRYGGDFQGVLNKLDYLQDLGVTALYFNPVNDAPSLHKFDARNWRHMDVNFGPDPEGDMKIMEAEDPADPATWQWTAADKQFLQIVDECHKRGIKVVVDYSWNHTGVEFWAFKDVIENQEKSKYKDWYNILAFDDLATPENEFSYQGWLNISSLPEIKKVDIQGERVNGKPYDGDQNEGAKQHIFNVTKRWLAPDGDVSKGIDGIRLDVADQIPMGFWRDYHDFVKSVNPEAYLVGEIWWEQWPDKLMNPVPYVQGDVFDAVMFYQTYRPARYFFAKTDLEISAEQLKDSLEFQWNRLKKPNRDAMMSLAASHDSPRLLTSFYNPGKYKYNAKPSDDSNYKTGKPDEETYQRMNLYLLHQFTSVGAPHVWNGDEMGMWGADDPDCRKPLWWPEYTFDPENRNNIQPGEPVYDSIAFDAAQFAWFKKLIALRKNNPVLMDGDFNFLKAQGKTLVYSRTDANNEVVVLFNMGDKPDVYFLPDKAVYTDLMNGGLLEGELELPSLSGLVLKREK
ncbi:MAG: alpha-amylase [Bacteroidetes bacterium]|nr:alpha-amylase [Bacteroidota bacterium]